MFKRTAHALDLAAVEATGLRDSNPPLKGSGHLLNHGHTTLF